MPTPSRETIFNAILAKIQGMVFNPGIPGGPSGTPQTTWITTGRRLKLWGDIAPDLQPAAYLVAHEERDEWPRLGTIRRRLHTSLWGYMRTDNTAVLGSTYLNTVMESVEVAFAPDNGGYQGAPGHCTLDGLVYWIRQEGRIFLDPGDIDNQAMIIVPFIVEVP